MAGFLIDKLGNRCKCNVSADVLIQTAKLWEAHGKLIFLSPSLQLECFSSPSCVFWARRCSRWAPTSKGLPICCRWCSQADYSLDQAMDLWPVRPTNRSHTHKVFAEWTQRDVPKLLSLVCPHQLFRTASRPSGSKGRSWPWLSVWPWLSLAWVQSWTSSSRRSLRKDLACSGHFGVVGLCHDWIMKCFQKKSLKGGFSSSGRAT